MDADISANPIIPVILSGGAGTRLWPLSTPQKPKQFLSLTSKQSMFQMTLERCRDKSLFTDPIIVGNADHVDLIQDQMTALKSNASAIILEPCARNTAPAIALAAMACEKPDSIMLVMPSDHVIRDAEAFMEAVKDAARHAQSGHLITFGITPTKAETGYGYILQGEALPDQKTCFAASEFIEKPDLADAEKMIARGGYSWNAGIFLFRADVYLKQLAQFEPAMLTASQKAMDMSDRTGSAIYPNPSEFARSPSQSIDYAVMEKAEKVAVRPVAAGWSDVGSWEALAEILESDDQNNVVSGNVAMLDSQNMFVKTDATPVATIGLEDILIIAGPDGILIMPKGRSQDVKKVAEKFSDKP